MPICTQGMQRTWWPEAGTIIVPGPYWKQFPYYWCFGRGIDQSPVKSHHKGQWCGASMMFSLICAGTNDWENNRDAGDLRRHRPHYDVIVMNVLHHGCFSRTGGMLSRRQWIYLGGYQYIWCLTHTKHYRKKKNMHNAWGIHPIEFYGGDNM